MRKSRKLRRTKKLRGGLSKKEKEQQEERDRILANQAKKELEERKRSLVKAHKLAYEERRKREKFAAIEKYAKENNISFDEAFEIIRKEEIEAIVKYYKEYVSTGATVNYIDENDSDSLSEICYDKRWTDDEDTSGFSKIIYLCDYKYEVMEKGLPWPLSNLDKKKYNEMNKEYKFSWPEEKNEPEETEEERKEREEKDARIAKAGPVAYDLGASGEGGARRKTKRSKTKRSKTKRSKTKRSKTKRSKTKRKNYI